MNLFIFLLIEKLLLLKADEEIKMIVNSFMKIYEETGFIESAPKCYNRFCNRYSISDGRIRIIQRIL